MPIVDQAKDTILSRLSVFDNVYTLSDIVLSKNGNFGHSNTHVLPEDWDRVLSQHVIAFPNHYVGKGRSLRVHVKQNATDTFNCLFEDLMEQEDEFESFMLEQSLFYFEENGELFNYFFDLLEPARRSVFCFIWICPMFLHLGDGTCLQVSGPFPVHENDMKVEAGGNSETSSQPRREKVKASKVSKSQLVIVERLVKKRLSSRHGLSQGLSYSAYDMSYNALISQMNDFIHKYDSIDSIIPVIFGVLVPERARMSEYGDIFESIKLNHMIFGFERTLDQIAGADRVTKRSSMRSLVSRHIHHDKVCEFMRRVLFTVFPRVLFGSNQNRQKFYRGLKLIVTSSRISHVSCGNVSHGINIKSVPWIDSNRKPTSRGHFLKFTSFVVEYMLDLLRSFFYVTETQFSRNKSVFYRKHVWRRIEQVALRDMAEEQGELCGTLSSLSTNRIVSFDTSLPATCPWKRYNYDSEGRAYPPLRVIPKRSSVRIIEPNRCCDREQLCAIKAIIRVMRKSQTSRQRNDLFSRFVHWCRSMSLNGQFVYLIRSDIQDCYPSINQDLLMKIVTRQMFNLYYDADPEFIDVFVLEVYKVTRAGHYSEVIFVPILQSHSDFIHQVKISLNQGKYRLILPREIIRVKRPYRAILNHVKNNIISLSKGRCFKLTKGVRQGDPISSDLSSLYIEHYLHSITRDLMPSHHAEPIVRYCHSADDMIFALTDRESALTVLSRILHLNTQFNLTVNHRKVQVNFDQTICTEFARSEYIQYFGFRIKGQQFALFGDYSLSKNSHIKYTYDSDPFRPLQHLIEHSQQQIRIMSPLLIDTWVNSIDDIIINLHDRIYFQCTRLAYHLITSPLYRDRQIPSLLLSFIVSTVQRLKKMLKKRNLKRGLLHNLPLTPVQITCIPLSALFYLWHNDRTLFFRKKERVFLRKCLCRLMRHDRQLSAILYMEPSQELKSIQYTR